MLFKEIIAVYTRNHTNPYIQNTALLTFKADGTYSYHSSLKGQLQIQHFSSSGIS
jgi:hypothetical protein